MEAENYRAWDLCRSHKSAGSIDHRARNTGGNAVLSERNRSRLQGR